jgi:hypothetical protein
MKRLEARLAALAAAGETITYGALARDLGWRIGEVTAALETLMEQDAAAGRPYRAAVCAQRLSADGLPAPGFFAKVASLGQDVSNPARFVETQRRALRGG